MPYRQIDNKWHIESGYMPGQMVWIKPRVMFSGDQAEECLAVVMVTKHHISAPMTCDLWCALEFKDSDHRRLEHIRDEEIELVAIDKAITKEDLQIIKILIPGETPELFYVDPRTNSLVFPFRKGG